MEALHKEKDALKRREAKSVKGDFGRKQCGCYWSQTTTLQILIDNESL